MSDPDYVTRVGETFPSPRTSRLEAGPYVASLQAPADDEPARIAYVHLRNALLTIDQIGRYTLTWSVESGAR